MARPWTVLPHRPLEKLQSNLWSVEADLPRGPLKRRMGIARLGDDAEIVLAFDEALEPLAKQRVVVSDEDTNCVGLHRLVYGQNLCGGGTEAISTPYDSTALGRALTRHT